MAWTTIDYAEKEDLNTSSQQDKNKVTAADLNQIKRVVNKLSNLMFPVGSIVMTCDGSEHPVAQEFPDCVEEIAEGLSLTTHKTTSTWPATIGGTIKQSDLPNNEIKFQFYSLRYWASNDYIDQKDMINAKVYYSGKSYNKVFSHRNETTTGTGFTLSYHLNGNVEQTQFIPKSQPIRAWKIIKPLDESQPTPLNKQAKEILKNKLPTKKIVKETK